MAAEKALKMSSQQELFGPIDVTDSDMSVSGDRMVALMTQYGLVPTNAFQKSIGDLLLQHKDGESISRLYAEKVHADGAMVEKLLRASERMLNETGEALRGCVDLVFWGRSCDVALVAFYETTIKTVDPAMWTYPSRLKFFCDSNAELERCQLLAEILFPNAEKPSAVIVCDLSDVGKIKTALPRRQFMIPRVHFVISDDATRAYFNMLKDALASETEDSFLDYFAFVGWDRELVCGNLSAAFGDAFEQMEIQDDALCFGKLLSNKLEERLRTYRLLRQIRELARNEDPEGNFLIDKLIWRFAWNNEKLVPRRRFLDVYECVQWLKPDELSADCLVFYPKPDASLKVFILKLKPFEVRTTDNGNTRDDEMRIARKWIDLCSRKTENSKINDVVRGVDGARKGSVDWSVAYNDMRKFVVVMCWDAEKGEKGEIGRSSWISQTSQRLTWDLECDVNLVDMYGVEFKGVSQLPRPDSDQEKIVYDRHQYRKVRGGPGTGKTLTMLWHSAQVVENRHLPVIVLGKTNTLTGRNLKALAATFCDRQRCSSEELKRQVEFSTVASFVCGHARMLRGECLRSRCRACVFAASFLASKSASQSLKKNVAGEKHDQTVDAKNTPLIFNKLQEAISCCTDSNSAYCICRQMLKDKNPSIAEAYRQKCCDACKKDFYRRLFSGEANLSAFRERPAYGGVMVDECQAIPCEELQACYLITAVTNRWREFYMFCDEEQHFRGGALEKDADSRMAVVRAPAKGFGRFITLTKNHRAYSRQLLSVYNAIQDKMARMYDVKSLLMVSPERVNNQTDDAKVFSIKKGDPAIFEGADAGFDAIASLVEEIKKEIGSNTILVLCDDVENLQDWSVQSRHDGWIVTHLDSAKERKTSEEYREERKLRLRFGERPGHVHLTGVDCAQGQTFENVLYVSTQDRIRHAGGIEELFTALTRARAHLRVVDHSESGWLYEMLKGFNG